VIVKDGPFKRQVRDVLESEDEPVDGRLLVLVEDDTLEFESTNKIEAAQAKKYCLEYFEVPKYDLLEGGVCRGGW
jgi:hypothetical protein